MGEVEYTFELAGTIRPVALIPRNESAFAFICAAADGRADALGRVAAIREGDAGIDRFGRVVEHLWYAYGASTDRDRYTYGYDRASNRLYRENTLTTRRDELYGYDQLNRLVEFARGELNANKDGIMGTAAKAEEWGLDTTGNWDAFLQKTSGTTDLDQARTHNPVNEITAITAATGTDWADPVHDRNGNMTTIPKPANLADALTAIYDAWNRLVEIKDGQTVIARYDYDGLNRRIESHIDSGAPSNPTGIDGYLHYYYTSSWQILETRQSDTPSAQPETLQPKHQHVWSQRYIDAPVLRDENTGTNGLCDDQRLYYLNDANFNVTALLDTSGDAVERYLYSPYGMVTIYDATWANTLGVSSYGNMTLYTGREFDIETGLYHYRNRYYGADLGRFVSRDPIGCQRTLSLFQYAGSSPVVFVDPLGFRECTCDCKGLRPFNTELNRKINDEIRIAAQLVANAARQQTGRTFQQILRDNLARDVPGTGPAHATRIEQWIRDNFAGTDLANRGRRLALVVPTADCILIECHGGTICIGSDKVGHFFQQGFMLHELASTLGTPYAQAFNLWTEGLVDLPHQFPDPNLRTNIRGFLNRGRFRFYGFEETRVREYGRKWGGFPDAPSSAPDARANLAGMAFWDAVTAATEFDICDYIDRSWEKRQYSWRERYMLREPGR